MPPKERHAALLPDPDINRWFGNFKAQKTAKDRLTTARRAWRLLQ